MSDFKKQYQFSEAEWEACLKVLSQLKEDPFNNPDNERLASLITSVHKQARKSNRKKSYSEKKEEDLQIINSSQISQIAMTNSTVFDDELKTKTGYIPLNIPKNCYCCNSSYDQAHSFYNRLCPDCAEINYDNRFREVDLTNRNVILTGGRVKIGYATALKFLRNHANLTVTTRLPALALDKFKLEADYKEWKERLTVHGLDLRNLKAVEEFVEYYKSQNSSLDILVNNAAQTIKYPEEYYLPLIQKENSLLPQFKENKKFIGNRTTLIEDSSLLKIGVGTENLELNRFGQPVDNRTKNSWNSTLAEVGMTELLEVNLINQISPYYLVKELTPLLKASSFKKKFIINVTSSEGQFSYNNKSIFHPHTNMTKASLNMLTRTAGMEYKKYGIFMNAVDVGWVSTGANEELRKKQFEKGYIPPLDPVDGAARILVPIIDEIKYSDDTTGCLLKNYRVIEW